MIMKAGSRPTVVDLFSGAGLFSYAFAREGFNIVQAVEINRRAAATYAANLGEHIMCDDVTKVKPEGRCDVLIGGPPCQGFSTLGRMDPRDPRNLLGLEMVRWSKVLCPSVVVIENVAAFLDSPTWAIIALRFQRLGYDVHKMVLNAADFGVPQLRSRSFTIASKLGPVEMHPHFSSPRTVAEAWEGLARRPDGRNFHYAPKPSPLALARMRVIPEGGDKRDVMERAPRLAPPSWWRTTNVVTDVWGRMSWDKPSNTLRTCLNNPSKGRYIHPSQNRVISLREAARLHTIADNWTFQGDPVHVAAQIGNSVPPDLGRAIARAVARILY